jgi:hypothetical protein
LIGSSRFSRFIRIVGFALFPVGGDIGNNVGPLLVRSLSLTSNL